MLLGVLGLATLVGLIRPLRGIALAVSQPVMAPLFRAGVSVRNALTKPSDINALQAETESLREENTRLRLVIANLEQAQQENNTLRQLLDFFEAEATSLPHVIARVTSRDPLQPSLITLNVGQRDGVRAQNAVTAKDGILVARIVEVFPRSSKALLLTDQNSAVAAMLSGGTPSSKLVRGERGLSLLFDQVPQQETLRLGQLVITSGLESTIPRGLAIGEIEEIVSERNDLFQTAVLRPLVDFESLSIVSVVLTPDADL